MPNVLRRDWTAAQYFADARLSNSKLKVAMENLRQYAGRFVIRTIKEPAQTAALRWGSLVHLRVLEPDDFYRTVAIKREGLNRRSNAGKEEIAEFEADGVRLVTLTERRCLEGIYDAVMQHPTAGRIVEACDKEVPYTWADAATGLECRCKFDLVRAASGYIADLKTTEDPEPIAFGQSAAKYGYHQQANYYSRPVAEICGRDPRYDIIAVRSEPPHEVAIYTVSLFQRAAAEKKINATMRRIAAAMESNDWSELWELTTAQPLMLAPWALQGAT